LHRGQSYADKEMIPRKRPRRCPKIIVPILRSGVVAWRLCRQNPDAGVEAVFERSFYLRSGDVFICVGGPAIGNGPLTLIADFDGLRSLTVFGLYPGQGASISDRRIAIGDRVQLAFDRSALWQQPPWPHSRSLRELNDLCSKIALRPATGFPGMGAGVDHLSCMIGA
jgi:hypothetical protein